jgi:hypothetical protein
MTSLMKALSMPIAAAMLATNMFAPAIGGRSTPRFVAAPHYDGDGKKMKPKTHPRHNAKRRSREWERYAEGVETTHSVDRFGKRQIDPRDDKYLHSHARAMRGLVRALDRRAAA